MAEPQASGQDAGTGDERDPFGAFISDQQTRQVVTTLAERRGWPTESVQRGGFSSAMRTLGVMAPPRLVVLETDGVGQEDALEGVREIADSGAIVIALGGEDDGDLFRYMLSAGAADYLVKPVDERLLDRAITRAETLVANAEGEKRRRGRCIAVIGSRGGVGSSTVASNMAWLMAERLRRRVMLVDLDLQFGTTSFAFDLQPAHGLREAIEDPERIDEVFLDRASQEVGERLRVLSDEEALDQPPEPRRDAHATLLDTLAGIYDVVVVDLPREVLTHRPDLVEQFTNVTIVSTLTLPSLRDTNRLITMIKGYQANARITVAVNQLQKNGQTELQQKDFGKQLHEPIAILLPFDLKATVKAMRSAKPIADVAPRSALVKALYTLSMRLVGGARTQRRSLFGRLFKRAA